MRQSIPPAIAKIAPDGNLTLRQKRRFFINMGLRRQKPGTGSSHQFMRARTAMNPWPDLRQILKDVPWVIVGDVATRAYMPEQMTKGLDVLVMQADGERAINRLVGAGFTVESRLAVPGHLLRSSDGVSVDVLFGDESWLDEALDNPSQDAAGFPVLGLPYLVLMKLYAMRAQDWADISRMLGWAEEAELEIVREVVARYSPQDKDDLESLIFLGQQERQLPDDLI